METRTLFTGCGDTGPVVVKDGFDVLSGYNMVWRLATENRESSIPDPLDVGNT